MMDPFDPMNPTNPIWNHYNPHWKNMSKEEREEHQRWSIKAAIGALLTYFLVIVVFGIIAMLTSCRTTRYVHVPHYHTDTVRIIQQKRDSIFRHDSVFINQYIMGDTVFQQKERWHTIYRDHIVRDTAYISRHDTVGVPTPVEVKVPAQLSWHQQARLWLGNAVIVALALCALVWLIRKRSWWLKLFRKK